MRIGIDLGGTKIEGVALAADGREVGRVRVATPRDDYRATVLAIRDLVAALDAAASSAVPADAQREPATVGVGIPGAISPATGRVKNANSTWLIGHALDADLQAALGRPVRLANDANCFALSEATDGAAAGAHVVFGVILGTGTGGGVVVGGRVVTGANAIAGEWGHNPLPWPEDDERPGPACYCGRHGCLETFLSGPGLAADHLKIAGVTSTGPEIVEQAGRGDEHAQRTLARHAHRLARGLASVINVLDPDVIVLGGGVSRIESLYRMVPELWGRWVFSDRVTTRLVPAKYGDASGVRGAAWLWGRTVGSGQWTVDS